MLSVFWYRGGLLVTDFLPKKSTFNSEYYCCILDKLAAVIKVKFKVDEWHPVYLLQDNARPHVARKTMAKLSEIGIKLTHHPPYSPDLSPSDYYLFRDLKNYLGKSVIADEKEAIAKTIEFFESKDEYYFSRGIDVLPERMQAVINNKGTYIVD